MKVKDYSYETFPRYTVNIDGALELKGNKENLRCRMKDVEYQKGCMIRFLFPNTILDEERKYPLVIHVQGSGWYKQDMNDHIFDFMPIVKAGYVYAIIEYHGAPEYKYPACIDDGYTALNWICKNAYSFGGNPDKIILSGDSAGATICASLALKSADSSGPSIYAMVLLYGMFGAAGLDSDSMRQFGNGEYVLPKIMVEWCTSQYVPPEADQNDPLLNPGKAKSYNNMPKSLIVTGEYDPLRDDGEEFYRMLKKSGNNAELIRVEGVMHGFMLYWNRIDKAKSLIKYINKWLNY